MSQRSQSEAQAPTLLVSSGALPPVSPRTPGSSEAGSVSRLVAGGRDNTERIANATLPRSNPPPSPQQSLVASNPTIAAGTSVGAQRTCPTCGNRFPGDFKVCPHDATPLVDAVAEEDTLIGATLGDSYRIVRAIGEGGMGRVYEARHVRLPNRRYAVKVLHAEYSRQNETVMRFQREAEAASGIGHSNVITVFDVSTTPDGRPYMVCELLEGEDFGAHLERVGRCDVTTTIRIVRPVCRALAAAHAKGVIHRDMKPENVFLSGPIEAPSVKLLDFGISKVAEPQTGGGATLTKTGIVMGTPAYMAPEQAMGLKVDPRADVYAVGAILYRALTGRRPFLATDVMTMLTAVMTEEPERPRSIDATIPEGLELVIQRAMAKEPADRFPTMDALDAALAPFDTVSTLTPTSPTTMASETIAERAPVASDTRVAQTIASQGVRSSRPTLVISSLIGVLWVLGVASDTAAAALRLVRGGEKVSTSESTLILIGVGAAMLTPMILWIRHLAQRVWPNSVRAIEVAHTARRTVTWSMIGFGIAALAIHLIVVLSFGDAKQMSMPVWHLLTMVAATVGAVAGWMKK
ncbi:MAG: serine/threonine-protein kinase [Polyangiaceae bacterium]